MEKMVSSIDHNKKSQHKDLNLPSPVDRHNNNPTTDLPPSDQLSLLFPKCKPRSDVNSNQTTQASNAASLTTSIKTTAISSSHSPSNLGAPQSTQFSNSIKQMKQTQSPPHKNRHTTFDQPPFKHEKYVETNPFRTGNNFNSYNNSSDRFYYYNNPSTAPSNNSGIMQNQHHYPAYHQGNSYPIVENRSYYMEPDEEEHNPYQVEPTQSIATIPSSTLSTTPPATPPALTQNSPDESPRSSSRNLWDLSPIKSSTPSRIKSQSPTGFYPSKSHKSSFKQMLTSPLEDDLDNGIFYYNQQNQFQPPMSDSASAHGLTFPEETDVKQKQKSFGRSKLKITEPEVVYAEIKKKEDRKIVKSKSGSGIIEYDGSPRRFGLSFNDDDYFTAANYKFNLISPSSIPTTTMATPPPPRPGFPQRIVSFDQQTRTPTPNSMQSIPKSYSFDEQPKLITTSTLIPTTFIKGSYDLPETKVELIEEQPAPEIDYSYDIDAATLKPSSPTELPLTSTFDYLYEFSETRKVLEEFFKCPADENKSIGKMSDFNESDADSLDIQYNYRSQLEKDMENFYTGSNYAQQSPKKEEDPEEDIDADNREDVDDDEEETYAKPQPNGFLRHDLVDTNNHYDMYLESASRSSNGDAVEKETEIETLAVPENRRMSNSVTNNNIIPTATNTTRRQSKNFHYSPDTTDYESNYGDFDSESSLRYLAADYGTTTLPTANATANIQSELNSANGGLSVTNYPRYCNSMPVLEDGLSSGHNSDTDNNNSGSHNEYHNYIAKRAISNQIPATSPLNHNKPASPLSTHTAHPDHLVQTNVTNNNANSNSIFYNTTPQNNCGNANNNGNVANLMDDRNNIYSPQIGQQHFNFYPQTETPTEFSSNNSINNKIFKNRDPELESLYTINTLQVTPPPPAPVPHRQSNMDAQMSPPPKSESDIQSALKDIRTTLQRTKNLATTIPAGTYSMNAINNNNNNLGGYYERNSSILDKCDSPTMSMSPVWIPRSREKSVHSPVSVETGLLAKRKSFSGDEEDEEDLDTDLETDRLLGHQRLDDGFYDDKMWNERKHRPLLSSTKISPKLNQSLSKSNSSSMLRHGLNTLLPNSTPDCCSPVSQTAVSPLQMKTSPSLNSATMMSLIRPDVTPDRHHESLSPQKMDDILASPEQHQMCNIEKDIDEEMENSPGGSSSSKSKADNDLNNSGDKKKKNKNKEVLIEGVLFRARYLGSTQLVCEGQPTKSTRMMQAEEAVSRIKALSPDGESQPSTEVDLFISTEKIMVLNTDLKEIMMDHALRTISYIADIGDLVVLMARRRFVPDADANNSDSGTGTGGSGNNSGGSGGPTPPTSGGGKINRTPKMICHVFESEEAQFIAQSIGQAFQVAYMEFLKANGIEDHSFMKEMDYQEVLNSQEIFGDELEIFAKKELQKEVVVPKAKGEILGVVIVESGWGSMLPTVVIANLASAGAAARCGQLNIGDQIIAINGLSLVGLPLSQCQTYIKNTKSQTVVKFTVVPCAPVVEVKIKRPNTKYQLGFSVQNGVICSLLRGGIAERGGVRVGHRIIEINNQSVVAVPHEKIVNLLATSVGEILMKTMPTSMFRLLTGQENPIYI